MALLTKSIGIVTPLVLSIVVVVARRLISYKKEETRSISYKKVETRSHRIVQSGKIISYMASVVGKEEEGKRAVQRICEIMKSDCNKLDVDDDA